MFINASLTLILSLIETISSTIKSKRNNLHFLICSIYLKSICEFEFRIKLHLLSLHSVSIIKSTADKFKEQQMLLSLN